MINLIPTMLFFTSFMTFTLSTTLMIMDNMLIMKWEICSMLSMVISMDLIMEWSSTMYSSIVMLISGNVMKFSKEYMKQDPNNLRFSHIMLLFILSMNLLIYIPNMACMLIGWDGLGITSFILVIYYNNPRSLSAGMLTMLTNRLGDMFLLMAIITTVYMGDWLPVFNHMNNFYLGQWLGIMMAAMTKSAQMPYSSWLPAAMAAPTPVSALVHSSTLVTAGIFLLYRFNAMIYQSEIMQSVLMISGSTTMLMAGFSAIYEKDMKKIIALSTLSQLGLMILTLGVNLPMLSFFHMSSHAMFKALLFMAAGSIISLNNHNQDLRFYGQHMNMSPMICSSLLISTMALMGIPFMTGYYSKHLIMSWSYYLCINYIIYSILLMTIFLTSYYSIYLILYVAMSPRTSVSMYPNLYSNNINLSLITLCSMSIFSGSVMQWMMPITLSYSSVTMENNQTGMINTIIMLSLIIMLLKTMMLKKLMYGTILNKAFSTLMFSTPISTQLVIPTWLSLSMNLSKYLDQTWLEKSVSMFLTPMMNASYSLNLLLLSSPQKNLMNMLISSMFFIFMYLLITL